MLRASTEASWKKNKREFRVARRDEKFRPKQSFKLNFLFQTDSKICKKKNPKPKIVPYNASIFGYGKHAGDLVLLDGEIATFSSPTAGQR